MSDLFSCCAYVRTYVRVHHAYECAVMLHWNVEVSRLGLRDSECHVCALDTCTGSELERSACSKLSGLEVLKCSAMEVEEGGMEEDVMGYSSLEVGNSHAGP